MARKLAVDRFLFAPVVTLVALGLLMIYSASAMQIYLPSAGGPSQPLFFVFKQGIAVLLGALLTLAAVQFTHIVDFMIMMPLGPQFMRLFAIGPHEFSLLVSSYTFAAAASGFVAAFWMREDGPTGSVAFTNISSVTRALVCASAGIERSDART